MSISGVGYGASALGQSVLNAKAQLEQLQEQLSTGKKSTNYAGMGLQESFAIAARAQIDQMSAFADTMTNLKTIISVQNTALQALSDGRQTLQSALITSSPNLDSSGQSSAQHIAHSQLSSILGMMNVQAGDRYVFSGSATDTPSVVSIDEMLNGAGGKAGLTQVITERQQADLGTGSMARLTLSAPTATSVALTEDGSPFGLKLNAINSTLTGSTVTAPAGAPPAASIDLGAVNPNDGETVTFTFNLPDGTTEDIKLTASSVVPAPAGSFAIGASSAATATNLSAALTTAIQDLSNTKLVAASAMKATSDFFGSPPQRVATAPASTAMTLTNGSATTVAWYTGEAGAGPARASAIARIDQSVTVQYGARANEQAIQAPLQALAVMAAFSTTPTNPNAAAQSAALFERVKENLPVKTGQQAISDIQSDLGNAQSTIEDVSTRQTQAKSMLQTTVDNTENSSSEEVIAKILALQTSLQASYQTTSMLSQLSLVKFLSI